MGVFPLVFVPSGIAISSREGYTVVVFSWLLSCLIGVLPYLMWGGEFSFSKAWFESVSGYSTTGSTILNDVEALPYGLLFWRAATHWMGGIGIIAFVLVILPSMGKAKVTLYKIEVSPLAQQDFNFRTRKVLHIILTIYLGLTLLEAVLLVVAGMGPFDAVCHAFATIATGGFSTRNMSIAAYNSVFIEGIIIFFMVVSGIHFGLLFELVTGKVKRVMHSVVVRYYLLAMLLGVVLVAWNIHGKVYAHWSDAFRYAAFQVASVGTTTGFANADSSVWPPFAIMLLTFFTIQCACAGSTSGGMKVDRVVVLYRTIKRSIRKLQHPNAIIGVKLRQRSLPEEVINQVILFIAFYVTVLFVTALLLTAMDVDLLTAFSASAATMGNVGPGFGEVSSLGNFSTIPTAGLWLLSVNMLLGRLEIFGLLLLFMKR